MRRNVRKLVLNRETVRALQEVELRQVVGGHPPLGMQLAPMQRFIAERPVTAGCPCASGLTENGNPYPCP
jgi:hypothetical protein